MATKNKKRIAEGNKSFADVVDAMGYRNEVKDLSTTELGHRVRQNDTDRAMMAEAIANAIEKTKQAKAELRTPEAERAVLAGILDCRL